MAISASQVLGLKVCATTPNVNVHFEKKTCLRLGKKYFLLLGGMYFVKDYYLTYTKHSENKQSSLTMDKRLAKEDSQRQVRHRKTLHTVCHGRTIDDGEVTVRILGRASLTSNTRERQKVSFLVEGEARQQSHAKKQFCRF